MSFIFFGSSTTSLPVNEQSPMRIVVGKKAGAFEFAIGRQDGKKPAASVSVK